MRKLLFVIPLLFLIQPAFGEIIVQNDQTYIGDDGTMHIVGEIQNNSKAPLNKIEILAILTDENGNEVDRIEGKMLSNVLMPGMKGGFDIITNEKISKTLSYNLEFDYKLAAPKSQVIDIVSSELTRDQLNNVAISGTIENKGEITANMINVVATLYDRDGNVVTVSKTQTQPDFLKPGDENFFLVPVFDKKQAVDIVDYTLSAESDEYTVVPEFPLGSGILLAASVSSYIILTRNPKLMLNGVEKMVNAKNRMSSIDN